MAFAPGQAVPEQMFAPITQAQLSAYAEASGDPNPIHLSEEVAKKMGLPGVIAHGMLIAAFVAERARGFVRGEGDGVWMIKRFQTRFKAMTFLGDVIAVSGTVKQASDSALVLELQAKNQRGETATVATAEFSRS